MKNKQYIKTELPITIITDDEYRQGDNLELVRQRIEKAALYVHSLFNTIRYSLENLPSFDDQKLEETFWDARNVCEIGYGVADSILASAAGLTEFQPDEFKDACDCKTDTAPEDNLESLAKDISSVLKNPELPAPLYDALQDALADMYDDRDADRRAETPEHIAKVLRDFKRANKSDE